MATITAFELKNHVGQLLDRVLAGEELVITRHGRPVAKISPVEPVDKREQRRRVLEEIQRLRDQLSARGVRITAEEVRRWKAEGRR